MGAHGIAFASPHKTAALMLGLMIIAAGLVGCSAAQPASTSASSATESASSSQSAPVTYTTTISIDADEWSADATPAIIHLEGCCGNTKDEDIMHAFTQQEIESKSAQLELKPGRYYLSFISPVNPDGSMYDTGDRRGVVIDTATREEHAQKKADQNGVSYEEALAQIGESEQNMGVPVEWVGTEIQQHFEFVPATEVTTEQAVALRADLDYAINHSNDTLGASTGTEILDSVNEHLRK